MVCRFVPWRKAVLKGAEVLARCDEAGELVSADGRVEVRYRPRGGRAYRAALRNLQPAADAQLLPDDYCDEADPPSAKAAKTRTRKKSSAAAPRASLPEGAIVAYTDGACSGNPGPAGAGVVLVDGNRISEGRLYLGKATNNIAELTAIEIALSAIDDTKRPVRVHTDSKYAIGVLTKGWRAKANQALIARLRELLGRFSDLELIYVPGHAGVPLNERADELAVEAVKTQDDAPLRPV